ncbi:MAG: ribonuclease H-like domain-containing protein [Chloroflexi bacterium]|nr:ribonuclease H-like domain-containing protein [Chloroflexota bacterium]
MLRSTFQFIDDIGPERESDLWGNGVTTWDELAANSPQHADVIETAAGQLNDRNAGYFQHTLPSRERWRIYADFQLDTAFLDIETTGLSPENAYVTMVGILDRDGFTAYVRGDNLDELPEALLRYSLFVSYNGASFDMPFLDKEFDRVSVDGDESLFAHAAHLDLRYPLRRLGFKGGLKKIEQATGTGRPGGLSGLSGYDAVRLWKLANDGEPDALETLIRYNAEDVASLPGLTGLVVDEMAYGTPLAATAPPGFPEYDTDALPYDPGLVRYMTRHARSSR